MPTTNQKIAGLAALACLLAIFCGALWWADSSRPLPRDPIPTRSAHITTNENHKDQPKESFWQRATDDPIAVFTLVLTIFTGILAWSTRRLVRGAEDTAERQLRAYVFTNPVNSDPDIVTTKKYPVVYSVHNNGGTPATLMEIGRAVDVFPYPLPKNFVFPPMPAHNVGGGGIVIGANIKFEASRIQADRLFTKAEINNVKKIGAVHRIYYYGWLIYKDVFGKTRRTEFCQSLVWESASKGSDGLGRTTWEITEGHNSFD